MQYLAAERSDLLRALAAFEADLCCELRALYASGAQKATLATAAGISRPTLDAWLKRPS